MNESIKTMKSYSLRSFTISVWKSNHKKKIILLKIKMSDEIKTKALGKCSKDVYLRTQQNEAAQDTPQTKSVLDNQQLLFENNLLLRHILISFNVKNNKPKL